MNNDDIVAIWRAGLSISGGFGFWMSGNLYRNRNPKNMVKAWIDALTARGYTPAEIVYYGNWTDGRHIADEITPGTTAKRFGDIVFRNARPAEEIRKHWQEESPEIKEKIESYTNWITRSE